MTKSVRLAILCAVYFLLSAADSAHANLIQNGDFSQGLSFYTTTTVSGGSCNGVQFHLPTIMHCLPSQNGNPFLAIYVACAADGYIEQQITLPKGPNFLTFRTWANLEPPSVTVSIVTASDNVVHDLETYLPPGLEQYSGGLLGCSGNSPIEKVYDISAFAGKVVKIRIRATSTANENNGVIADFDDLQAGSSVFAASAFYGFGNPAMSQQSSCGDFAGDPVNCDTGNLSERNSDMAVRGRGRFLALTRTYNAIDAATATAPGAFGFGWSGSYSMRLTTDSRGAVTVHQENGATVTFTPAKSGFVAPASVTAKFVRNRDGSSTFTLKDQRSDSFDSTGRLISESDRNGYLTHIAYDGAGHIASVTDPAGRALMFITNASGLITSVTDPIGRSTHYTYDGANNLVSVADVGGGTTRYTYDGSHRLLTITDPKGGVTRSAYDARNRVVSQTDPMGRRTQFAYSAGTDSNTVTVTDPNSHVSVRTFSDHLLTTLVLGSGSPDAATWTYLYDSNNRTLDSVTDANGNIWGSVYDAHGNLVQLTDPLGNTSTTQYNSRNDPAAMTDPLGVTTTFAYDPHGNLASVSRPLNGTPQTATTTFTHSDVSHPGDVTAITDADGFTTKLTYDADGNVVSRIDPLGGKLTSTYNTIGFLLSFASPRGHAAGANPADFTTSFTYNAFGDVTTRTDPLGNSVNYTYDARRNLLSFTDQLGHKTRYSYDADDERTLISRADGTTLQNHYDSASNLVSQIDGLGHATKYSYNELNRLVVITDALGRTTSFSYDGVGDRKQKTDPSGGVTKYYYDAAREFLGTTYSDSTPLTRFSYDADGSRISMEVLCCGGSSYAVSSYAYDSLRRLTSHTDGAGNTVSYGYNLRGLPTGITYPNGKTVLRSYDGNGRLTSVADWLGHTTNFSYDADGNPTGESYPNTWNGIFNYDHDDRLLTIGYVQSGKTPQHLQFSYGRDKTGLVTTEDITSSFGPGSSMLNQYDALKRLTASGLSFSYDAADHLTAAGSATRSYDIADELSSGKVAGTSYVYGYDSRGNRVSETPAGGKTVNLTYDLANRLTAFGSAGSYVYDGDGLRTSKTVGGHATSFVWDTRARLPQLIDAGGTLYVYGSGALPLEEVSSSGVAVFYHHDQLGSTRFLTDAAGSVAATYTYGAYGNTLAKTGTASTPFQFAGQVIDSESGLQYLRRRYYDPATGQFISRDPLLRLTREAYAYVHDNPKNEADPTGMDDLSASLRVAPGWNQVDTSALQVDARALIVDTEA